MQQQAYEEIKRRVITLEFRPGEYLNEASVCLQLGFGRMPVHQAIKRLNTEGMVQVVPRKGVIVNPITLDEVKDLIEVRAANESLCAALAAERASEKEIEEMREILACAAPLTKAKDQEKLMELDREFHQAMARAARNRVLAELLARLHERSLRFWFITLSKLEQLKRVEREHRKVFKAIEARDPEAAASAIRAHIASFRRAIVKAL